ncbi:MAG: hypothetical protein OXC00_09770 [Acidimicrobiaceae bacterium]|nr:hypothetical protein [Acidimicrobiaceae bacterium]
MSRPRVLVTAPLRGPALDELRDIADAAPLHRPGGLRVSIAASHPNPGVLQ